MEQLEKKENARKLEVIAAVCKVNPEEVLYAIADSMETANKTAKKTAKKVTSLSSSEGWVLWWVTFLREWSHRCYVMCTAKCGDLKDYQKVQNLWLSDFELLWIIGCEIVRTGRMSQIREVISKIIMSESPSKDDEDAIWQWINSLDEAVFKGIDLFKQDQRRAIAHALKDLQEFDEASILGKLKHLLSSYTWMPPPLLQPRL